MIQSSRFNRRVFLTMPVLLPILHTTVYGNSKINKQVSDEIQFIWTFCDDFICICVYKAYRKNHNIFLACYVLDSHISQLNIQVFTTTQLTLEKHITYDFARMVRAKIISVLSGYMAITPQILNDAFFCALDLVAQYREYRQLPP